MYFPCGHAKVFGLNDFDLLNAGAEVPKIIQITQHMDVFLLMTESAMYFASVYPPVILSKQYRNPNHIKEYGVNLRAAISSKFVAIVTVTGNLFLYSVSKLPPVLSNNHVWSLTLESHVHYENLFSCAFFGSDLICCSPNHLHVLQITENEIEFLSFEVKELTSKDLEIQNLVVFDDFFVVLFSETAMLFKMQNLCFACTSFPSFQKIAFNKRFNLFALGVDLGFKLIQFNDTVFKDIDPKKEKNNFLDLYQDAGYIRFDHSEEISCMQFTQDGHCLAISFLNFGFSLFSTFGTHYFSANRHFVTNKNDYIYGIDSFFWGPQSFELFILKKQNIYIIPFMKSFSATNQVPDNFLHGMLLSSDAIIHYSHSTESKVSVFKIPQKYLSSKIRIAAVSQNKEYSAVAGSQGLALFVHSTQKWSFFDSFLCLGLCFLKNLLFVLVQDKRYKILVFDAELSISSNLVLQYPLIDTPCLLSRINQKCVIINLNGFVYEIEVIDNQLVSNKIGQLQHNPAHIISFCAFSSFYAYQFFTATFLMDFSLNKVQQQETKTEFIISTSNLHSIGDTIWLLSCGSCNVYSQNKIISFALDFVPIAVSQDSGVIFGLMPHMTKMLNFILYAVSPKSLLFLPEVFEYLLKHFDLNSAHEFAMRFKHLGYFNHALEILLHNIWEREAEKDLLIRSDALLPSTITFIRKYDDYVDIIVNCARKTELSMWRYLFSIIGSPRELFHECLERNKLDTAAAFLIVLHNIEPETTNGIDSMILLEKLLQNEDFETCKDLVRFIYSGSEDKLWVFDKKVQII